ncbi:MAG: oligoendopeptidase F [Phycisphaerales bacterium]|nr:oligoendopeptidase F [Phycisphaerales bacterium]
MNPRKALMAMSTIMITGWSLSETAVAEPEAKPMGAPTRDQIAEKDKWNLKDIFDSNARFEAAFKKVEGIIEKLPSLKGTLGSPEGLLKALKLRDETFSELDLVIVYAGLSYHQDMSVGETQGRWDRVQSLGTKAGEAVSWFVPEVLTIPSETADSWMSKNKELAAYRHALQDIHRQKKHFLSPREEELLAMAGEVTAAPGNVFGRFTNTDLDFPVIKDEDNKDLQLSSSVFYQLLYSPDRRVRRDAFLGLHDTYASKMNTLSALLSSQVKQHIFYAKARHYDSSLEAALSEPNIPVDVYRNLIATVSKNAHRLHRYVAMRKKLMKLDAIHRYDLYVPMVSAEQEEIPYEDAVATILKSLKPLGSDYVSTLETAFKSRWIDVYETKNKRSGAYCWGAYKTHPYLLLNYKGTMNDRSTVTHEMGHAMHSWYTAKKQPYVYGDYETFCAEVASTVNEVLLAHYLLNHAASDTERLLILQQQIEGIRTTVFRQTMFAEFELKIHEMAEAGEPLTGNSLRETYEKIVRRYYGPEIVLDPTASAECLRIPHFYRNFYVFTYATSHCAATNIGRRIIDGEAGSVEGLIDFLSAGSSKYPLDVLKLAGVDMATPKPIEDTMALFSELLDHFEKLYEEHQAKG